MCSIRFGFFRVLVVSSERDFNLCSGHDGNSPDVIRINQDIRAKSVFQAAAFVGTTS